MAGVKGRSGGRNRKPVQLHVLQGTFNATRHAHLEPTPEPPAGTPSPRDLSGEALAEWERMIARLSAVGTLSLVDDAALRRYCQLHAQAEHLAADHERLANLSSRLMKTTRRLRGAELVAAIAEIVALEKLQARAVPQCRQSSMALRSWLVEFGLTPASRTRVKASATPARAAGTIDPKKRRYLGRLDKA